MSLPKILGVVVAFLVAVIIVLAWPDRKVSDSGDKVIPKCSPENPEACEEVSVSAQTHVMKVKPALTEEKQAPLQPISDDADLPQDIDRIQELFSAYPPNFDFVETLSFSSKVHWLTGRLAYLGDYAKHHQTSKHFISRSLCGTAEYFNEKVCKGDRFNVFKQDRELEFHLVVDLSRLKMWFYCYDGSTDERTLLKTYRVSAGKLSASSSSSTLTPTGLFALGKEIAVYKEGVSGRYKGELTEMITIFGTRWIPVAKEITNCSGPARGLGLHGIPWERHEETGALSERRDKIGKYESLGCIHLLSEDIAELYAIIATKPSYLHVVKDFALASLPGCHEN